MAVSEQPSYDNTGRARMGPASRKDLRDALWPYRHGKWWNWSADRQQTETVDDLLDRMRLDDLETAEQSLNFAESVAQTALDRAEAADRRATTVASSVAIAGSFTLSGAGLLLDTGKWTGGATLRAWFAVGLVLTTVSFVLAAVYALRALVFKPARTWNWLTPANVWRCAEEGTPERRLGRRAAVLLSHFAANWEIADFKNRNIDNALRCLVCALLGLTALALIAALTLL